jgi:hypothetical protein
MKGYLFFWRPQITDSFQMHVHCEADDCLFSKEETNSVTEAFIESLEGKRFAGVTFHTHVWMISEDRSILAEFEVREVPSDTQLSVVLLHC